MTSARTDAPAFGGGRRLDDERIGADAGPARDEAARWVTDGHRHLMLLLSALAADHASARRALSLRHDSEHVLALFEEAALLHSQATTAERERDRLHREVQLLRERLDLLKLEREEIADELTSAANAVLARRRRLRAGACRSSAFSA